MHSRKGWEMQIAAKEASSSCQRRWEMQVATAFFILISGGTAKHDDYRPEPGAKELGSRPRKESVRCRLCQILHGIYYLTSWRHQSPAIRFRPCMRHDVISHQVRDRKKRLTIRKRQPQSPHGLHLSCTALYVLFLKQLTQMGLLLLRFYG